MYATCLFCNAALGGNEAIEHCPVGRRLAFDAATGRLWVVCQQCARWNLSPLETRWEAIEEAERLFRATKLRVFTDNIGLARLRDGTELVRIGKPTRPEFAGWRYGDVFGRRYRKHSLLTGVTLGAVGGSAVFFFGLTLFGLNPGILSGTVLASAIAVNGGVQTASAVGGWNRMKRIRTAVADEAGRLLHLTAKTAREVMLVPPGYQGDWRLKLPRNTLVRTGFISRALGIHETTRRTNVSAYLRGDVALRALAAVLPQLNEIGANKTGVNDALAVLDDTPSVATLMQRASADGTGGHRDSYMNDGERAVADLPDALRLALEMSLHADDERRAMEGELHMLEQRWRDADAIAKIADNLFRGDADPSGSDPKQ